jgi:hypothetical protein
MVVWLCKCSRDTPRASAQPFHRVTRFKRAAHIQRGKCTTCIGLVRFPLRRGKIQGRYELLILRSQARRDYAQYPDHLSYSVPGSQELIKDMNLTQVGADDQAD